MGKKVKEYKPGDFIFAKVKGYPEWPARVQRQNGKKYFVYFYGTGETANLAPNSIFDFAENKDKFFGKSIKRKDYNEGVKQIEYDFANNVPLEDIIGVPMEIPVDGNDTLNDTANDTANDSTVADTTNDTLNNTANTTANDGVVEDSDEAGALVIDEGKKGKKAPKTPAKVETPAKVAQTPQTPTNDSSTPKTKGRPRRTVETPKETPKQEDKKEEELVSRSGRKIRPKRYLDEHTEENVTLPSPTGKKRLAAGEKEKSDKPEATDKPETKEKPQKKEVKEKPVENNPISFKEYNVVSQGELEQLDAPFPTDEKKNILIAYLPTGRYIGIKLFQSRPSSTKSEAARLQWDKQAAINAINLKNQLEKGHITPQSVASQLEVDLNLTDEEKATLDKEREIEEKESRVQFLKTEMKLIELDAKVKTCLSVEKADTELCLKLLDEVMELDIKPLMLFKHPGCLETLKRMRSYVGNTPSWDLSEQEAAAFSKQAHLIRKQADTIYKKLKDLFTAPNKLSFWEYFSERVMFFKKVTSNLKADELLEMVHEPVEMSKPSPTTMQAAIDAANDEEVSKDRAKKEDKKEKKEKESKLDKKEKEKEAKKEKESKDDKKEKKEKEIKDDKKEKQSKEDKKDKESKEDKKEKESKEDKKEKESKDDKKEKESKEEKKEKESKEDKKERIESESKDSEKKKTATPAKANKPAKTPNKQTDESPSKPNLKRTRRHHEESKAEGEEEAKESKVQNEDVTEEKMEVAEEKKDEEVKEEAPSTKEIAADTQEQKNDTGKEQGDVEMAEEAPKEIEDVEKNGKDIEDSDEPKAKKPREESTTEQEDK